MVSSMPMPKRVEVDDYMAQLPITGPGW